MLTRTVALAWQSNLSSQTLLGGLALLGVALVADRLACDGQCELGDESAHQLLRLAEFRQTRVAPRNLSTPAVDEQPTGGEFGVEGVDQIDGATEFAN